VGYLLQLLLVKQQLCLSSRQLMTLCRKHQSCRQQQQQGMVMPICQTQMLLVLLTVPMLQIPPVLQLQAQQRQQVIQLLPAQVFLRLLLLLLLLVVVRQLLRR
jgi:hypothetical protein